MGYVFISYAHMDQSFVKDALIPHLKEAGIQAWVDSEELRGGEDWRKGIDQAIEDASSVIVVMTPKAKSSEYVTYEWAYALGATKTVIPILLKATKLHPRLEIFQHFDFKEAWNAPWDRLIRRLLEVNDESRHTRLEIPEGVSARVEAAIIELNGSLTNTQRNAALDVLMRANDASVPAVLAQALEIPRLQDIEIQIRIAKALAPYNDLRAAPVLLKILEDSGNEAWYREACDGLARIGYAALPDLVAAAGDRSKPRDLRIGAIRVLGKIGKDGIETGLVDLLQDRDSVIRGIAADALGDLGDHEAVPQLIQLLSDKADCGYVWGNEASAPMDVSSCAAYALKQIGTLEALTAFKQWQNGGIS